MKKVCRAVASAVAVALAVGPVRAAGGPGSAFGEALRLTNTAWALSMSEALAASAEGVNAVALNPAGVLDTGVTTLHLTHVVYVQRLGEDYAAYAQRLPFGSALGVGVHALYDAGTMRTLEDPVTGEYAGEAGSYTMGFAVGGAAYAMDLSPFLPWIDRLRPTGGVGLRMLAQQVDRARTIGFTTDVGVRLRLGGGFLAGGVLQNAGLARGEARLPLQWVTGLAWQKAGVMGDRDALTAEVDAPLAVDRRLVIKTGIEYRLRLAQLMFALRGGWKQENDTPGAPGLTGGVGFRWLMGRTPWGLDYAYIPWGVFGGIHAASVTLGLVPPPPPAADEAPAPPPVLETPATAFYPLKGERARYVVRVASPAELSAVLLDANGAILMTLRERGPAEAGTVEVAWDGLLSSGLPAPYDARYRILIQLGDQTYYQDVIPRGE